MSVRQIARVLELPPNLSPAQRMLLVALADCADHQGDRIFPGVAWLTARTGLSKRYLYIALRKLIDAGYVEVVRRGGHGQGQRTIYRLHLGATQPKLPLDSMGDQKDHPKPTPENALRVISRSLKGDLLITPDEEKIVASGTADDGSGAEATADPSLIRPVLQRTTGAGAPAPPDHPKHADEVSDAEETDGRLPTAVRDRHGAAGEAPGVHRAASGLEGRGEGSRAPIGVRHATGGHRRPGPRCDRTCPHDPPCATLTGCIARTLEGGRHAAGMECEADRGQAICAERAGLGRSGVSAPVADRSDDAPHGVDAAVALDPVEGARLEALTHIRTLRSRL